MDAGRHRALASMGALDFAGGAVVHVNAAAAALVAALVVGPRKEHGRHAIFIHLFYARLL